MPERVRLVACVENQSRLGECRCVRSVHMDWKDGDISLDRCWWSRYLSLVKLEGFGLQGWRFISLRKNRPLSTVILRVISELFFSQSSQCASISILFPPFSLLSRASFPRLHKPCLWSSRRGPRLAFVPVRNCRFVLL